MEVTAHTLPSCQRGCRVSRWPRWPGRDCASAHRRRTGATPALARLALTTLLGCLLPASAILAEDAAPAPAQKTLRVATSGDYAPFSFAPPAAASSPAPPLAGFDIELATLFARERGYNLEFVRFRWPDLGRELAAGSFDVAMSGVTMKPERSVAGRYSVPVAATHAVALTWKGSGVNTVNDLDRANRRIAVNAGGYLETVARRLFRRADIIAIADNDAVRMAMLDRTFDAVISDNFEARIWAAGDRDVVRIGPLSDDRKACLLPADRADLAAELDRWLLAREKDGTLARLRSRYLSGDAGASAQASTPSSALDSPALAAAEPVEALGSAIVERLTLMPMVYEAKRRDGKPIEDKTQEEAVLDGAVRAVASAAAAAADTAPSGGTAAPSASAPPDIEAVRLLFEALIAIGKDAQQQLAEEDAKKRAGIVLYRPPVAARPAAPAGADSTAPAEGGPAQPRPDNSGAAPPAAPPPAGRQVLGPTARARTYDLATELRPAIARITDKIARILVAMDEPVSADQARRRLSEALAPHGVRADRMDALATAVARISSRRAAR